VLASDKAEFLSVAFQASRACSVHYDDHGVLIRIPHNGCKAQIQPCLEMCLLMQVKAVMSHVLREAADAHPPRWNILMSTYASTPLGLRSMFAQVRSTLTQGGRPARRPETEDPGHRCLD